MKYIFVIIIIVLLVLVGYLVFFRRSETIDSSSQANHISGEKTAIFAGGCFWCVEADYEKVPGVLFAVSGYSGGKTDFPTYEDYAIGGHREVVEVTYDPSVTSYEKLVEHILLYSDGTDADGSFHDRGAQYSPAIYYENDEERMIAEAIVRKADEAKIFDKPLTIVVLPRTRFWLAEEYHQDYYKKNPIRYNGYRTASGRNVFIERYRDKFNAVFNTKDASGNAPSSSQKWASFQKPSDEVLRKTLTPLQYSVTQKEDTERPFGNEYDTNKAEGIYVDIVSGEPLYSSKDKYDSGTGWPSFVKPINPDAVVLREDNTLFVKRTEVRSRYADSHLGHVFDDGPADRGGKRYCMNSAAMRFVPKDQLESQGYGEYARLFE